MAKESTFLITLMSQLIISCVIMMMLTKSLFSITVCYMNLCAGKREPTAETGVFRAAQQTADQTSSGLQTAGGGQVGFSKQHDPPHPHIKSMRTDRDMLTDQC